MSVRTWAYGRMTSYAPLTALIGGINPRVYAKKTLTSSVEEHPYLVYKLGNEVSYELSEEREASRQFLQVWIHDFHDADVADYMRIDDILKELKAAFKLQGSAQDGIWLAQWIETSQDFNDDTLNTIFRYARFQITKEEI